MIRHLSLLLMLCLSCVYKTRAQLDSVWQKISISGYVEAYYSYDAGNPGNHERPSFLYAYNRHNEVNINLAFVKLAFDDKQVRSNLAIAAGTYMNANLAGEPGVLKNIYEANAGVRLSRNRDLWLDAGVLPGHIGFESAEGKDCWTLTRSLMAENSPYFETGVRFSYTSPDKKWYASGLLLNGWQRIKRVDGNNTPAFGHQLMYKPNKKITLNSSSFIGNDKPDSTRQMRYFHNLYGIFIISKKWSLTTGFDIGAEQQAKGSHSFNTWYTANAIMRYSPGRKSHVAARLEYYSDVKGVIVNTGGRNTLWGYSINYDQIVNQHAMIRLECRRFSAVDRIFRNGNIPSRDNICLTACLAVSL